MVEKGKKVYQILSDTTINYLEQQRKADKLITELNKDYPRSTPVGKDSIKRIFFSKHPVINNFAYSEQDADEETYEYNGIFQARLFYDNAASLHLSSEEEEEDKVIGIRIEVTDLANEYKWRRLTDLYYASNGLKIPYKRVNNNIIIKAKNVVDSRGRSWVEEKSTLINPDESLENSGVGYKTLINERYLVYMAPYLNTQRPEYKKYKTEPIVTPDFFYKVADIDWIEKLPK